MVVADAFGPPSYAPRLRSVCEHLVAQGWFIELYTEQFVPLPFAHDYPIYECPLYRNRSWDWTFKALWSMLTDWKERAFSRWLLAQTKDKQYDLVFCTTFSTFPLHAAWEVARAHRIPLHVDLRDIDEQAPNSQYQAHRQWWARPFRKLYRAIQIRRRNKVVRQADSVTTVSPWHVDFVKHLNPRTTLIYNGYDQRLFVPQNITTDTFRILYTGRIYERELQDPMLFIQAVSTLPPMEDFIIDWYTDEKGQETIRELAIRFGCEALMHFHPYVSTGEIPALLHQCSIALVLSHKAEIEGPHGIMTTKFFEALGVEKPVLCVPSDEESLADVIQQTNAGIAASDAEQVRTFIMDQYTAWKAKGYTRQAVHPEQKKRFTRQYQAQQFEQFFRQLIQPI